MKGGGGILIKLDIIQFSNQAKRSEVTLERSYCLIFKKRWAVQNEEGSEKLKLLL